MMTAVQRRLCFVLLWILSACAGTERLSEGQAFQLLFDKGRAYLERGNPQMALPALRRANTLQPGNAALLSMLGLAYDQVGRPVQALEALEEAHRLQPDTGMGHLNNNLGVARLRAHTACVAERKKLCHTLLDQAEEAFEAALQDASMRVPEEVWLNRALLYKRRGYLRQMVAALKYALKIKSDYLPARLELAKYYRTMRRPDLEKRHLRKALANNPENLSVLEALIDVLWLSRSSFNQEEEVLGEVRTLLSRVLSLAPGTKAAQRASQRLLLLDEKG